MPQITLSTGKVVDERSSAYHTLEYVVFEGEFEPFWSYLVTIIFIAYQSMLQNFYGTAEDDEAPDAGSHALAGEKDGARVNTKSMCGNVNNTETVTVKPSTPSSTGILTPASSTIGDQDPRTIDSDANHDQHQANADELSTRTMPSNIVSWNKLIQFADDKHLLFPRCPSKILELYQAVHQNASLASDRQSSKSPSISFSTLMSQQSNLVVLEVRGFPGDRIKMFVRMRRDNTFSKLKEELREEYSVPESCSLTWRHS